MALNVRAEVRTYLRNKNSKKTRTTGTRFVEAKMRSRDAVGEFG
jgi:hypothetical protein